MSTRDQLGQRAWLLHGMLIGGPKTTTELYDCVEAADRLDLEAIEAAVAEFLGFHGGSTSVAIAAILDGGSMEVLYQLKRLEDAGVVGRLGELSYDQCLWWALEPSAW